MQNSGFFNGDTEYGQEEFNRYFNNLYENGVSIDDSGGMTLGVSGGSREVTVAPGFAIVRGFYYYNDSSLSMTVTPDANYNRIDRLVLRLNVLSGPIEAIVKKGTAGSTPAAPSLQRDNYVYEISLAQLTVAPNGVVTVDDERFDATVCGAIRPRNLTEYKDMVAKFQRQFEDWFNSQQAKGWRNIFIQDTQPGTGEAVTGSIWI